MAREEEEDFSFGRPETAIIDPDGLIFIADT
jgi:hypothetical protein